MSEVPLPPPVAEQSYGPTLDVASQNYANNVYFSGESDGREQLPNKEKSQLEKELELNQEYAGTEFAQPLAYDLDELKRFAGIGIPKLQNLEKISGEGFADEDFGNDIGGGYAELGSTMPEYGYSSLALRPSVDPSLAKDYSDMNDDFQRYNADIIGSGSYSTLVASKEGLGPQTQKLMSDLYNLTEAILVRDDGDGNRVLEGVYQGVTVYFHEINLQHGTFNAHSLVLHGSESGRYALEGFSSADLKAISNNKLDRRKLEDMGITHDNLGSFLGMAAEINAIPQDNITGAS